MADPLTSPPFPFSSLFAPRDYSFFSYMTTAHLVCPLQRVNTDRLSSILASLDLEDWGRPKKILTWIWATEWLYFRAERSTPKPVFRDLRDHVAFIDLVRHVFRTVMTPEIWRPESEYGQWVSDLTTLIARVAAYEEAANQPETEQQHLQVLRAEVEELFTTYEKDGRKLHLWKPALRGSEEHPDGAGYAQGRHEFAKRAIAKCWDVCLSDLRLSLRGRVRPSESQIDDGDPEPWLDLMRDLINEYEPDSLPPAGWLDVPLSTADAAVVVDATQATPDEFPPARAVGGHRVPICRVEGRDLVVIRGDGSKQGSVRLFPQQIKIVQALIDAKEVGVPYPSLGKISTYYTSEVSKITKLLEAEELPDVFDLPSDRDEGRGGIARIKHIIVQSITPHTS